MSGPSGSSAHPLALKVMRVSRPSIVTGASWQPALADTPAVLAHSAASPLSLQGSKPLQGIPTSLRDLTAVGPLLHLPTAFGLVQLGETFSCCLSLSNEITIPIEGVKMQIEMHTAANKTPLQELGGSSEKLAALASMDTIVHFEIKELGQHTLACIVQYRTPQGESREFSKYYKFPVTNPLSVKTKVHVPQSATALMSPTEKDKVFLEVHIQNVTQEPMWFERLRFEPVEGLVATDGNVYQPLDTQTPSSIFSGWSALMHPSDVRQYLYIISPTSPTPSWGAPAPGSVVPLGRLDITWRTTFGEPARLLTSVLTRRVPLAASATPLSLPPLSIPSVVQRALGGTIPRPASPASSIASGPPSRPGSPSASAVPYKPRVSSRSTSPTRSAFTASTAMIATVVNRLATTQQLRDLSVDLMAEVLNRDAIQIGESFSVDIKLVISTTTLPMSGKLRRLKVAVQHTISSNPAGLRSRSSMRQGSVLPLNLPLFSPRTPNQGRVVMDSPHAQVQVSKQISIILPSPYSSSSDTHPVPASVSAVAHHARTSTVGSVTSGGGGGGSLANRLAAALHLAPTTSFTGSVEFLGASVINLPPIMLHPEAGRWTGGGKVTLEYLARKEGLAIVGGLRLLLLVDEEVDESLVSTSVEDGKREAGEAGGETRILNAWSAIGEVWVMS